MNEIVLPILVGALLTAVVTIGQIVSNRLNNLSKDIDGINIKVGDVKSCILTQEKVEAIVDKCLGNGSGIKKDIVALEKQTALIEQQCKANHPPWNGGDRRSHP
jgi:hypothetical protein